MNKKKLQLFITLIYFLSCSIANSQNQEIVDSLLNTIGSNTSDVSRVNTYIDIAEEYHKGDSINTLKYANKAIELANSINYVEGAIDALYPIAVIHVRTGNLADAKTYFTQMLNRSRDKKYLQGEGTALFGLGRLDAYQGRNDQGLEYIVKSLEIRKKLGLKNEIALNYNMIGHIYMKKSNYDEAIENYYKSLKLNEEIGNLLQVGILYNNIGIIHKNQDEIDKAIENYNKSLKILLQFGRDDFAASNYTNMGNLYLIKGEPQRALEYQFKALKLKEGFPDKREIAYSYDYIGQAYLVLKEYPKALKYAIDALKIYQNLDAHSEKAGTLILLGKIHKETNQLVTAKRYLLEGLELAQNEGLIGSAKEGAEQLSIVEEKLGNYKKAYEAYALFKQMADSTNNEETIKKIARLEIEYEFQTKKDSIESMQQKELLLIREKTKRTEYRNLSIGICLLLILITGAVIYVSVSQTKRTKELDSLRNHISQDLHDEIGSTLSSISLFGTVAQKNIKENPKRVNQLLSRINSNATQTIESINDIVWAIKSENDSLLHLVNRMRSFASELEDTGQWKVPIDYDVSLTEKNLNMIQRRNIYLIFKEALNNAIKYSKGDKITVEMISIKNRIQLKISDNGTGFDYKRKIEDDNFLGGNGLKNMKMRAEELGGLLEIVSSLNKGTQLIVEFPT